ILTPIFETLGEVIREVMEALEPVIAAFMEALAPIIQTVLVPVIRTLASFMVIMVNTIMAAIRFILTMLGRDPGAQRSLEAPSFEQRRRERQERQERERRRFNFDFNQQEGGGAWNIMGRVAQAAAEGMENANRPRFELPQLNLNIPGLTGP